MDRQTVYQGQIPLETDLLLTNKNTMLALGSLIQAALGTSVSVDGLACTPNSPAALNVLVGPGAIHSLQNVDGTAYGTVPADTANQVMKQGLFPATQTFSCPAPPATGQSIVYLIQAAYQDTDAGGTVLPYYNASNPSVPWSGPGNTGVSQNTVRKGVCTVSVKAGVAATTGSQTTPAADAGYTGLYAITVANGATTITSGNIQRLATAPFIDTKLPNLLATIQQDTPNFAQDTSVAANTITISLSPQPTLTNGMPVRVKVANSSTGATVMSVNGGANIACKTTSGADFASNTVVANGIYTFVYDANGNRFQLQGFTAASATGLVPANNLSDVSNPDASLANLRVGPGFGMDYFGSTLPTGWLWAAGQAVSRTTYANLFAVIGTTYGPGDGTTTFNLPDKRGRVSAGKDDMNGSGAGRLTNAGSGVTGTSLGAAGGAETVTLTTGQMPAHDHQAAGFTPVAGQSGANANHYLATSNAQGLSDTGAVNTGSAGSGQAHNNVQPTLVCNYVIKH